jgi:hypothetical protein
MPRFPLFPWGATVPAIPEPEPEPPFWTNLGKSALAWSAIAGDVMPRFEHIFAQEAGAEQQFVKLTTPPTGAPD